MYNQKFRVFWSFKIKFWYGIKSRRLCTALTEKMFLFYVSLTLRLAQGILGVYFGILKKCIFRKKYIYIWHNEKTLQ